MHPLRRTEERPESDAFDPPAQPGPGATIALERVLVAPSADARALQDRARAFAAGDLAGLGQTAPQRWSKRRTLVFAVGTTLLLWGGVFMMGWAIVQSLA